MKIPSLDSGADGYLNNHVYGVFNSTVLCFIECTKARERFNRNLKLGNLVALD